jgi:hypothetical protein
LVGFGAVELGLVDVRIVVVGLDEVVVAETDEGLDEVDEDTFDEGLVTEDVVVVIEFGDDMFDEVLDLVDIVDAIGLVEVPEVGVEVMTDRTVAEYISNRLPAPQYSVALALQRVLQLETVLFTEPGPSEFPQ